MQVLIKVKPRELSGSKAIIASLLGAAFTAVCAQVVIPIPGNPVPITMQVFAVLVCGMMLGSRYGMLAQLEYLALGMCGAPIFAGFRGGPLVFLGPDGGYLVGFAVAAYIVGKILEINNQPNFRTAVFAGVLGVGTIYTFGVAWLGIWLKITAPTSGAWLSWALGAAPFAGIDAAKAALAAGLCFGRSR